MKGPIFFSLRSLAVAQPWIFNILFLIQITTAKGPENLTLGLEV